MSKAIDVVVIGGGQAGLVIGYYLRRADLSFVPLDGRETPGGAWQNDWPSLRLFSPAQYSSLPGRPMPASPCGNPDSSHVIDYLADYEERYRLPVQRPIRVEQVDHTLEGFRVATPHGAWQAHIVVNTTGTWSQPFWPHVPGQSRFRGNQVHSAWYQGPERFANSSVLVVGGAAGGGAGRAPPVDPSLPARRDGSQAHTPPAQRMAHTPSGCRA